MKVTWTGFVTGVLLSVAASTPAFANAVYSFIPNALTYGSGEYDPRTKDGVGFVLELKNPVLDIDNSTYSMFSVWSAGGDYTTSIERELSGDIDNFVSISLPGYANITRSSLESLNGILSVAIWYPYSEKGAYGNFTWTGNNTILDLKIEDSFVSGTWTVDYNFGGGSWVSNAPSCFGCFESGILTRQIAAVPEPASLTLLGFGLAGLVAARRRTV